MIHSIEHQFLLFLLWVLVYYQAGWITDKVIETQAVAIMFQL